MKHNRVPYHTYFHYTSELFEKVLQMLLEHRLGYLPHEELHHRWGFVYVCHSFVQVLGGEHAIVKLPFDLHDGMRDQKRKTRFACSTHFRFLRRIVDPPISENKQPAHVSRVPAVFPLHESWCRRTIVWSGIGTIVNAAA